MSITTIAWLVGFLVLLVMPLRRAAYGFSLYAYTFFLFPSFWWWGKSLPDWRWNLVAAVVFLGATIFHGAESAQERRTLKWPTLVLLAIVVNATLVHLLLAADADVSIDNYILLIKFAVLLFLMRAATCDKGDLRVLMWSMVLGAAYIGFEVTVNDRGTFHGARLEDIGAAGVQNANELASLMATILPVCGALFLGGTGREKIAIAVTAPLIMNVVLLCNSRGAFLSLVGASVVFMALTRGAVRKRALKGLALGGLALFLLLGDPQIVERFSTVFVDAEERDHSSTSRLLYWQAAAMMIKDHPLGAGGDGYSTVYSGRYLRRVGVISETRSAHNGYLTEATEWGIQGLSLRLLLFLVICWPIFRTVRRCHRDGDADGALVGISLLTSTATFLGTCLFGDYMDGEWGYWMCALMLAYERLYRADLPVERAMPMLAEPAVAAVLR